MTTIYEVAKEAGVSPKTAARVLSGASARPKNREAVLEAARKLGYIRNQQAANLRSGKSGLLGLVIPTVTNPYYPWLFQKMHDIAVQRGYQLLLSSVSGGHDEVVKALQMMEVNRVEGLIFNMSEEEDQASREILERFLARKQPVIVGGMTLGELQADEIVIENVVAVQKGTDYLIKTGHKALAFVSGPLTALGNRERREGFLRAVKKAGLEAKDQWVVEGSQDFDDGFVRGMALLREKDRPTAIMCGSDLIAIGVMKAAQQLGLAVGKDVAVVGFNDTPWAKLVTPSLTTLRQPQNRIAQETIGLLVERIDKNDVSNPRKLVFEPELIIRDSA